MSAELKSASSRAGGIFAVLGLCALIPGIVSAEVGGSTLLLAGESIGLSGVPAQQHPAQESAFPMILDRDAGLTFDVGGSETRKLQLVLDHPLSLTTGYDFRSFDGDTDVLGLDATLAIPLSKQFSLDLGLERRAASNRFYSLGSIHCANGVLRADSYTASGCRFVNEPTASLEQQQVSLGTRFDLRNASASLSAFGRDSSSSAGATAAMAGPGLLSPNLANPLLAMEDRDPLSYLNSEASGVDLNFQVGVTTDSHGDLQLGLAFSRVLEADFHSLYAQGPEAYSWTLAEPFNSARMNLEWSRGAFSTGIEAYYRDSVDFLDRNSVDNFATFDVHFTWRTPWNANLSVGASSVLSGAGDHATANDSQPTDPLESIYGRIPYVRYKQDL